MIRYTSNRKYANAIKDLNRKYNEKFFNINNRNVAGYDVTNRVWFFDENIVDYNDYLRYARFTPEQLKYLRHFSTNLTNLFQEIDSKIDFQNFNTRYKFEGDVYSVYKSDTTTVIYLTDSVKGTEKLRVVYYKAFHDDLENTRILVTGSLSIYKGHGEIQLLADAIKKPSISNKLIPGMMKFIKWIYHQNMSNILFQIFDIWELFPIIKQEKDIMILNQY